MSNRDVEDSPLLNRIGRIIYDLVEGDIERNVMLQKICDEVRLEENTVTRIIRFGIEDGLFEAPTSNQVKLTALGANRFSN